MSTEVLVMCTRCGRPQAARKGHCVACGELLPEAPLPAPPAPEAPFLQLEARGGRTLTGVDRRLTYRSGAAAPPVVVELGNLQAVALGRRFLLEILLIVPLAWALVLIAPSLRPLAALLAGLSLLGALLWRQYALVLRTRDGGLIRWPLGIARLGSEQARRLDAAWSSGAHALASRGVSVHDAPRALGPRA